jgi:hypothetical protein
LYNSVHIHHCHQSSFPSLKCYVLPSTQPINKCFTISDLKKSINIFFEYWNWKY